MDLENLYITSKINYYFYNKLKKSIILDVIDPADIDDFLNDIEKMSKLGVSSPRDEYLAKAILLHVHDIINDIKDASFELNQNIIYDLYLELFNNKELLNTDNVFCTVADAANKVGIPLRGVALEECSNNLDKKAYPQGLSGEYVRPIYDISQWMQATRDIYYRTNVMGVSYNQAFSDVTSDWDSIETLNFKHWLKFYNEGVPSKYPKLANKVNVKTAQFFGDKGFFLPPAQLPHVDKDTEEKPKKPDMAAVRDSIEQQRSRIISRLTSAERLLASLDGQSFAGDDQELMLKLLQDLKRKVQTANKITIKSSIFEDFIYRAGNAMKEVHNSNKGKVFFYKLAQMDPFAGAIEPETDQNIPYNSSTEDTKQAFREFKERLFDGVYDSNDDPDEVESPKKQVSEPIITTPTVASIENIIVHGYNDYDIIVTAQDIGAPIEEAQIGSAEVAPQEDKPRQERPKLPPEPASPIPAASSPIENIENDLTVTEDESNPEENSDDVIEAALQDITIHDAISRLEILVGIYKKREVPRQLAILDIMMDTLGLSSFFPSLGEAMAKSLESSQYVSTRLEDVLNKLKGSIESQDAQEWITNEPKPDPETISVQNNLQKQQDDEQARKQMRKERDNAKLEKGEKGKTEVGEQASKELAQPAQVETGKPLSVR